MTGTAWRDMIVGMFIAAFAATMLILYQPAKARPTFWRAVGQVGVAMVASMLVTSVSSDIFKLTPKVTFSLAGVSGILGVRVFVALSRYVKRFGINLDDAEEKEWSPGEDMKPEEKKPEEIKDVTEKKHEG